MAGQVVRYKGKIYTYPADWSQDRIYSDLQSKPVPLRTPEELAEQPPTSRARAFGSGVAQGVTLGFSDELAGALGGDTDAWRKSQRQHQSTHPGAYYGGNVLGALGSAGAVAAALPVAGATGGLGAGMTALRAAVPRLAALGAAEGAVAGAGYSDREGAGAKAADAAVGAVAGGVLSPLLPGTAWGARALARRMKPGNRAAIAVNRGLQESGVTPPQAQARVDANPAMVVADTATDTQQQLGTLSRRAGETPTAVERTIVPRNTSQVDRFEQVFADALGGGKTVPEARTGAQAARQTAFGALGTGKTVPEVRDAVRGDRRGILSALGKGQTVPGVRDASQVARRNAAKTMYTAAYDTPITMTPALREVVQRESVRKAFKASFDMVDESLDPQIADSLTTFRQQMQQSIEGMDDGAQRAFTSARKRGNVAEMMRLSGVTDVPSPVMDYLGRVMRLQADTQFRGGKPGAHITSSLRRRLMTEIDAQNPALAQARGVYAGARADEEALDIGRRAMTDTVPEFKARYKSMSASERDNVRVGIHETLMDRVTSGDDDLASVRRLVGRPKFRAILGQVYDDETYGKLLRSLDEEEALDTGRKALTDTVPEFRSLYTRMSKTEQANVRAGIHETLTDRLTAGSEDLSSVRRLVGTRKADAILTQVYGADKMNGLRTVLKTEAALDVGRKVLTETVPEFATKFRAMSPSEKNNVRIGVYEMLTDRMKSGSDDVGGDVRRLVNNRKAKDVLSLVLGGKDKYATFLRMLDDETAMSATTRAARSPQAQRAPGDAAGNIPLTGFLVKQAIAKLGTQLPAVQSGFRATRDLTGRHLLGRTVPPLPARTPMTPLMRALSFPAAMGLGPDTP